MIIRKKRIRDGLKTIKGVAPGEEIYVSVRYNKDMDDRLKEVGFPLPMEPGTQILPIPIGPASRFNSMGKDIVHKDKPMETHYRQGYWTWTEFRGRYDRVEQSKVVDIPYKRYPRTHVPGPAIELTSAVNEEGESILIAGSFAFEGANSDDITAAVNLFLELFGQCEILNKNLAGIIPSPVKRLNWEILPPGEMPWAKLKPRLDKVVSVQPPKNQAVINERIAAIEAKKPTFHAVGNAGFSGYLIFGFEDAGLFVLESTQINNATYILGSDWKTISGLTKAEILSADLHKHRVIHRESWFKEMGKLLP